VLPQELQLDTEGEPELALLSSPGRGGRSASCVTLKQQIHVNLIPTGTSLHIMRKFPWYAAPRRLLPLRRTPLPYRR
jgi:hypothetical protein